MKRVVSFLLCSIPMLVILSSCAKTCKYENPYTHIQCEERATDGDYCDTHSCGYCSNPITEGSAFYCEEHQCQFDIGYGRCDLGVSDMDLEEGIVFCYTHRSIEDIEEFKAARDVASSWCRNEGAKTYDTFILSSPFKFTDQFVVLDDGYKFEVQEMDKYYRDGYVIIKRNADGTLKCDGLRWK